MGNFELKCQAVIEFGDKWVSFDLFKWSKWGSKLLTSSCGYEGDFYRFYYGFFTYCRPATKEDFEAKEAESMGT